VSRDSSSDDVVDVRVEGQNVHELAETIADLLFSWELQKAEHERDRARLKERRTSNKDDRPSSD
jgi:hypothetical protein